MLRRALVQQVPSLLKLATVSPQAVQALTTATYRLGGDVFPSHIPLAHALAVMLTQLIEFTVATISTAGVHLFFGSVEQLQLE